MEISQHLHQSLNSELQQPVSKLPVTGDDSRFAEALKEPKIIHGTKESLNEALRLVMVKVGLRAGNWPDDMETAILINHICTNYGNHTASEIRLAFDMAMAGKLNLDAKEVICYENFSCLYFSLIMNAYRLWAKIAYDLLPAEPVKQLPAPEDKEKFMSDWLAEVKEKYLTGLYQLELLPLTVFDWAYTRGLITYEKKLYFLQAKE